MTEADQRNVRRWGFRRRKQKQKGSAKQTEESTSDKISQGDICSEKSKTAEEKERVANTEQNNVCEVADADADKKIEKAKEEKRAKDETKPRRRLFSRWGKKRSKSRGSEKVDAEIRENSEERHCPSGSTSESSPPMQASQDEVVQEATEDMKPFNSEADPPMVASQVTVVEEEKIDMVYASFPIEISKSTETINDETGDPNDAHPDAEQVDNSQALTPYGSSIKSYEDFAPWSFSVKQLNHFWGLHSDIFSDGRLYSQKLNDAKTDEESETVEKHNEITDDVPSDNPEQTEEGPITDLNNIQDVCSGDRYCPCSTTPVEEVAQDTATVSSSVLAVWKGRSNFLLDDDTSTGNRELAEEHGRSEEHGRPGKERDIESPSSFRLQDGDTNVPIDIISVTKRSSVEESAHDPVDIVSFNDVCIDKNSTQQETHDGEANAGSTAKDAELPQGSSDVNTEITVEDGGPDSVPTGESDILHVESTRGSDILDAESAGGSNVLNTESTGGSDILNAESAGGSDVLNAESAGGSDILNAESEGGSDILNIESTTGSEEMEVEREAVVDHQATSEDEVKPAIRKSSFCCNHFAFPGVLRDPCGMFTVSQTCCSLLKSVDLGNDDKKTTVNADGSSLRKSDEDVPMDEDDLTAEDSANDNDESEYEADEGIEMPRPKSILDFSEEIEEAKATLPHLFTVEMVRDLSRDMYFYRGDSDIESTMETTTTDYLNESFGTFSTAARSTDKENEFHDDGRTCALFELLKPLLAGLR